MSKKARAIDVQVKGVPVRVHVDADGQPLYATAALQRPDDPDHERLVALAATVEFDARCADAKRKRDWAARTAKSAENRAKASAEHFAYYWLALAHAAKPRYGRDKLSREARRLAACGVFDPDGIKRVVEDPKKRDEINPYRAQQYLDGLSKPRKPPA